MEYGIKIFNFQAGAIEEYNYGVRDRYDITPAMLTNSLFKDYMVEHGLEVINDKYTRDIIGISYDYGAKSYKEQKRKYKNIRKGIENDRNLSERKKKEKLHNINYLDEKCDENKDKYHKFNRQQIRTKHYKDGVEITYKVHENKKLVDKTIKYKMLYRTPGKAKKGMCMFINEELYDVAKDYLWMGVQLPEKNAPIVEIGAYSSLSTSTIVGKIKIDPHDVLILDDYDSFFETDVISIETNEDRECYAVKKENYKLKNTMFDGQALIDTSVFPEWADGYVLLRNHFCKMAAFHTEIQMFFKDWCNEQGIDYDSYQIADVFGNLHYAKDIKVITTTNAMKWYGKFDGITYDYWCDRVIKDNNSYFGIVKTVHESKLGDVQQMSYQMINAMNVDDMNKICKVTVNYINKLKSDDKVFLEYLERTSNFFNDNEVLLKLVEQNPDFVNSEYFKYRRSYMISGYVHNVRLGKVIQDGDNETIVGSPYAMLLHTVGEDPESDPTFYQEDDCIQCYTERFDDGEYIAEFRNPFNGRFNLGYLHNHYDWRLQKYFHLGKLCIAINMVHTDFEDRNNGSDMDGDSIYITNQYNITRHAKYCYANYPTIVNNIPKDANHYDNIPEDFALIDNNLANSQRLIGESSNLAQIALTYSYNFEDQKYQDYVCILSILAQACIDSSKRLFDIDLGGEIQRIKEDMRIQDNKYPLFWKEIKKKNDKRNGGKRDLADSNFDSKLICPMNMLSKLNVKSSKHSTPIPMDKFFVRHKLEYDRRRSKKVEELIEKYSLKVYDFEKNPDEDNLAEFLLLREDFDELIKDIKAINISRNYLGLMSWLIDRAFIITNYVKQKNNAKTNKNRPLLLKTLYTVNPEQFLKCFTSKCEKDTNNICTP